MKDSLINELNTIIGRIEDGELYDDTNLSQQLLIDEIQSFIIENENKDVNESADDIVGKIVSEITLPEETSDDEGRTSV